MILNGPAYPAARASSARVHEHLARHRQEALRTGVRVAPLPEPSEIERIIETAFWASLRREEGYVPRISLAFLPPDTSQSSFVFERRIPLAAQPLTRLAPAVEREGLHLGVWHDGDDLSVWGTTRSVPAVCFVLEVSAPGLLVVKHHRGDETGKYVNVAVLEGDEIKIINEHAGTLPDCPSVVAALVDFSLPPNDGFNVLIELAVSMRAHGRGGALLVVPHGSHAWRESIVTPMLYAIDPPYTRLADLAREGMEVVHRDSWRVEIERAVDAVAGLTAVDGATIVTDRFELLAFGAKIVRRRGSPQVEQITITEPVEDIPAMTMESSQVGGTRHLSAAQFVQDQRDALALVASQDRHFTIFAWSPCEGAVHAHRVETLLL